MNLHRPGMRLALTGITLYVAQFICAILSMVYDPTTFGPFFWCGVVLGVAAIALIFAANVAADKARHQ